MGFSAASWPMLNARPRSQGSRHRPPSFLRDCYLRGEIPRREAGPIMRMPERTARRVLGRLLEEGLLVAEGPRNPFALGFPSMPWDTTSRDSIQRASNSQVQRTDRLSPRAIRCDGVHRPTGFLRASRAYDDERGRFTNPYSRFLRPEISRKAVAPPEQPSSRPPSPPPRVPRREGPSLW